MQKIFISAFCSIRSFIRMTFQGLDIATHMSNN